MNRNMAWIVVGVALVAVGIGAAVGLGLFRRSDAHPLGHPQTLVVAAASADPAPDVPTEAASATPQAEGTPSVNLLPHVEYATRESTGEQTQASAETPATVAWGPIAVTVGKLASSGPTYAGREVILTGRILNLCVRGCQLSLDDGTGVIPVELVDDALGNTIPLRSVGRRIEITGIFRLTPRPHVSVERRDGWRFP